RGPCLSVRCPVCARISPLSLHAALPIFDLERTFVGGGFGRGLEVDIVRHAVRAAMAVPGRPVQVLWSREQDLAHDYYRPAFAARDRKSTRLNSSHVKISYAVFCLKKTTD